MNNDKKYIKKNVCEKYQLGVQNLKTSKFSVFKPTV